MKGGHHLRIVPDSSWFQIWSGDRHVATFYDEADANDFVAGHVLSKLVLLRLGLDLNKKENE